MGTAVCVPSRNILENKKKHRVKVLHVETISGKKWLSPGVWGMCGTHLDDQDLRLIQRPAVALWTGNPLSTEGNLSKIPLSHLSWRNQNVQRTWPRIMGVLWLGRQEKGPVHQRGAHLGSAFHEFSPTVACQLMICDKGHFYIHQVFFHR